MNVWVALLIASLLCSPSAYADASDDETQKTVDVFVKRAIDGETIELSDGKKIRLIGVNTTNAWSILTQRFKLPASQVSQLPIGRLAADANKHIEDHVVGRNVVLSFDPGIGEQPDAQGRIPAYVWYQLHFRDTENQEQGIAGIKVLDYLLNQELVNLGYAFADTTRPFLQQEQFLGLEKQAAGAKRGFWKSNSEIYKDLLNKAQDSQYSSTASFVGDEAREISLEAADKAFADVIKLNPNDYQPYYSRSWLGASAIHNKVSEKNLSDVDEAIRLYDFNPNLHMQRYFLLRLLERDEEAEDSFMKLVKISRKIGLSTFVSDQTELLMREMGWKELTTTEKSRKLAAQAIRAAYNQDHFLFFNAWLKRQGDPLPADLKAIVEKAKKLESYARFEKKYADLLIQAKPRQILYKTQWAIHGLTKPEDVIKWMETEGADPVFEEKT